MTVGHCEHHPVRYPDAPLLNHIHALNAKSSNEISALLQNLPQPRLVAVVPSFGVPTIRLLEQFCVPDSFFKDGF